MRTLIKKDAEYFIHKWFREDKITNEMLREYLEETTLNLRNPELLDTP
jgi:hypothetical protein